MGMFQSVLGFVVILVVAWLFSEKHRKVDWRMVIWGVALQFCVALLLLKAPVIKDAFLLLNGVAEAIDTATGKGTAFVFGYVGGGDLPFEEPYPGASFILAFRSLPIILIMSALSALLFYWRVLPYVVKGMSFILRKVMGVGGALGLGAASNVFVGMVESPLLIRPYLKDMTRSELFALMTCGMATIAGTMLIIYATVLGSVIPDSLGHIITASLISAPAALLVARLMVPETGEATAGELVPPQAANGSMDAITKGTMEGLRLLACVVAMLIVLVALVGLVNILLGLFPDVYGAPLTLERIFGWVMAPLVWLMGVPWDEAVTAGSLMGVKTVLNEFVAYLNMAGLPEGALSEKSRMIMTYAMCGFANFGSLGIMIGGMGAMAPERRDEIVSLGMKSIVAGTLATSLTGAVVGIIW
ncbi:MAG: nucleoside:proton symporter [Desulfovibrio sp.]|nr:MAG: nucleoside:proton symporter [Desulfovibrio sp.]